MSGAAALPDVIGRVLVRSATDTPADRLGLRGALERARLPAAPGSSAREILIVRWLSASLGIGGSLADPSVCRGLESSLQRQLADARRQAVPLDGRPVPPGAWAVVARDLTQLLSLYVVDLADARVPERWWWRTVAPRVSPHQTVAAVLAAHPRESPHIVAELVRRGRLGALDEIDETASRDLVTQLADTYRAPRLVEVAWRVERDDPIRRLPGGAGPPRPEHAPRRPFHRLLVEVATQLARDPVAARGDEFVTRALAVATGVAPGSAAVDRATGAAASASAPGTDPQAPRPGNLPPEPEATPADPSMQVDLADESWGAPPPANGPGPGVPGAAPVPHAAPAIDILERPAPDDDVPVPLKPASPADATAPDQSGADELPTADRDASPSAGDTGTITGLGGVFFLLQLSRELGMPDVFEPGWRLASTLGAWGTIDLVARSLLPTGAGWESDPVWDVLAGLADGSPFDRALAMPVWVPAELPEDWAPGLDSVAAEPRHPLARTLAAPTRHGARRWLRLVRPFVCGALCERLALAPEELAECLFVREARIWHDRTHVDVAFPLAAADVAIRSAGLDRNPGWVPGLARVVAFHFDDQAFSGVAP